MDLETAKVILAASTGIGGTLALIDVSIKILVGLATLIYIILKIKRLKHSPPNQKIEDDEHPME